MTSSVSPVSNQPLLVFGLPVATELALALDEIGRPWKAVGDLVAARMVAPDGGWSAVVVSAVDAEEAVEASRIVRALDPPPFSVVLLAQAHWLGRLAGADVDDFVLLPLRRGELGARLDQLARGAGNENSDLVTYGALTLDLATYQAAAGERPLDLTYMEYELLRFFVTNPGRVYTREELLRTVWGYEYYGGARTVDVHVRRLRAKLGEEHAPLIGTVRSVGYIFGRTAPRW